MNEITSLDNEKVKNWVRLKEKKYRDETSSFLIETEHLVEEAIKNNLVKEIITIDNSYKSNLLTYYVTESIMKKITDMKSIPKIIAKCNKLEEKEIGKRIIILDNIQDPGNLGAIIRSAVAFNFDTIVLSNDSVDLYNEKVLRSSEGMIFNINIIRRELLSFINELKEKNYIILGTNVNNGTDLKDISIPNNICFVVGNEGSGINKEVSQMCDNNIYININNKCESLNVSVATGIILYELDRISNNAE